MTVSGAEQLHLAAALVGAGWHPAAWREPGARPAELLTAGYWADLVTEAERGLLDFVTFPDALSLQSDGRHQPDTRTDQVRGRLDAARVAPLTSHIGPQDYWEQVDDILALLRGSYASPDGIRARAIPGEGAAVQVWILGSSGGQSADVAGRNGLRFAANYHISPATVLEAADGYRAAFRPSAGLDRPYLSVSADVVVAETEAAARELATLIVTTITHDHADRVRSYQLLAQEWSRR